MCLCSVSYLKRSVINFFFVYYTCKSQNNTCKSQNYTCKSQDYICNCQKYTCFTDTKSFDDAEIESTILKCSQDNDGYLLCPHTAVAVKYFYELKELQDDNVNYVCIATASPAKFPEAIEKSGLQPYYPPEIQALFELEEKFETMDQGQDWEKMLREKIVQVST
mgnify:CR=1 FL=1